MSAAKRSLSPTHSCRLVQPVLQPRRPGCPGDRWLSADTRLPARHPAGDAERRGLRDLLHQPAQVAVRSPNGELAIRAGAALDQLLDGVELTAATEILRRFYLRASNSFPNRPLYRAVATGGVLIGLAPFVRLANALGFRREPLIWTPGWTSLVISFTVRKGPDARGS